MGRLKKLRILFGLIKDRTSILKANLSTKRHKSQLLISVVRATAHGAPAPPSGHRVDSLLSLGGVSRKYDAGSVCIEALMSRLQKTKNAAVALKSLFLVHIIITKGSFIIKNQLSLYLSKGGLDFRNFSKLREGEMDCEIWGLVDWVRWYSVVLEHNFRVWSCLGYCISSSLSTEEKETKVWGVLSKDLLGEIEILVDFVEVTSDFPDSLDLQKNDLIYEIVKLVSDDYRAVQHEIGIRVGELRNRIPRLSYGELTQFGSELRRFESFKERFNLLFMNRNRNDELWELVEEAKMEISEIIEENEKGILVKVDSFAYDSNEWTRFDDSNEWTRFDDSSEWVHLAVTTV